MFLKKLNTIFYTIIQNKNALNNKYIQYTFIYCINIDFLETLESSFFLDIFLHI